MQRHRIRRQVLELTVSDEAQAQALYPELSRIQSRHLAPLIERCLSAFSTEDRLDRLDILELDLGELDPESLEQDFLSKLDERLRAALRERIVVTDAVDDRSRDPGAQTGSGLELLAVFARTGSLPWWADPSQPDLPRETLRGLARAAPRRLASLIRAFSREPRALTRIVLLAGDDALSGVAAQLAPVLAGRFESVPALLSAALAETGLAPRSAAGGARSLVWRKALERAVHHGGDRIDAVQFWREVLIRVALALGTSYAELLADLRAAASKLWAAGARPKGSGELRMLLDRLHQDLPRRPPADARRAIPDGGQDETPLLDRSGRSDPELAASEDGEAEDEADLSALPKAADERASRPEPATLQGRSAEREESGRARQDGAADRGVPDREPGGPETPDRGLTERERDQEPPLDLAFSDVEELYIENAGLVLLWPFLPRFFEHLGLVEDKRFRDEAAVQRAVGLLEIVASGAPELPEYRLPLNKLLCGMALDAVFDFGPPVTEAEASECERLLEAVIEQAPILRRMSVEGFRGSFLLRKGVLGTRDGAWLLRVERESYDLVLDRFPWSLLWVKLPWMEAPLRVEW